MLTTKNWRAVLALLAAALIPLPFCGCTPAGPRALLDGERLLHEHKYTQAVTRLQQATRLLPFNAQAWNHLGLAYHHSGDAKAAFDAYEQARRCDQNLTPVRYNLGCLLLEDNNPQAAVSELTAFTLLERDSADGWFKLGTAQLRTRQWDPAQRSLETALRLRPDMAEAWNSLGVIQTQHKHPKEALNCFTVALQNHPNYAPALLNLGALYQFHLNNRPLALQKYQQYVELNQAGREASTVRDLIRQLRAELTPVVHPENTNRSGAFLAGQAPVGTSNTVARASTNPPALSGPAITTATQVASLRPRPVETGLSADPNSGPAKPAPEPVHKLEAPPRQVVAPPLPRAQAPTEKVETVVSKKPEVVAITDEPPPKVAEDLNLNSKTDRPDTTQAPPIARSEDTSRLDSNQEKRRLVERLNPGTWFKGKRRPAGPTPLEPVAEPVPKSPVVKRLEVASTAPPPAARPPAAAERRYSYEKPTRPIPGDRRKAERAFARAVQAHRDRRLDEAITDYRQAVEMDPSFFEAQYNLGLAAYELKDLPRSLSAYEAALSINPTSANARYNFALALEQGAYFQDSARELEQLLEQNSNETRGHLSLASIYAEKLGRPDLARPHFRKVLELEPQHPEASAIRYWLASNP